MKCVLLAMLIAISVAWAEESEGHKSKQPYVGIETGKGYHEVYVAQPLGQRWQFHGLIYRTQTEESGYEPVGFFGPSFRLFELRGLEASLGAGLYAGRHQPAGAALLGELIYENKHLKGEGVYIQNLLRPEEHGPRDKYLIWYFGPQIPCWSKSTFEFGFAQDVIGHNRESENLRGIRLAIPIPKLKHTKGFVKILSHSTVLWGAEFRP
jgi:hypothetical protein